MRYKLRFHELAWAEWQRLDASVRMPLKKKLLECLDNPHRPAAALSGMKNCYKVKLRQAGYRLIYRVDDDIVFVTVIAVGKRDKAAAYQRAAERT